MSQKTIKRTIELNYQAKGIETIKKELEKIKPFSGSTDLFKNLSNEIAAFEEVLKLNDIEDVTPEFAKEFEGRYAAILKGFEKLRLEITKQVDAGAATEIEKVIGFLEEAEKTLQDRVRDLERFQKIYSVDDKGKVKAETKKYQKETMDQAGENILVSGEKMTSLKGAEIKRADTMVREFETLSKILDQISNKSDFINKNIEEGTVLTQGEVAQLQEIINKARENGEIQENFRITAREINENIEIRNRLEEEQQKIMKKHIGETLESMNKEIAAAEEVVQKHREKISALEKESSENKDLSDTQKEMAKVSRDSYATQTSLAIEAAEQSKKRSQIEKELVKISREGNQVLKDKKVEVKGLTKQILNYSVVFNLLKKAYRETINTVTELDKSLTEMTVVTTMTRKEAWSLIPAMEELAKQTGFTTTEVAGLTTQYLKQGRTLRDAITLAEVAAKAARISGISSSESVTYLTAAINGFSLAAKDAIDVSDRFAALAASSATSYEELAVGLSKFAAQAHVAGMSIDFAMGMLAKGVETTREAPETIGTALKTVISRMRELTDLGKTLEDGMDVNRVEKALGQVGIDLRLANGQFRDMQDVLTDVGKEWDKFTNNQRASVAVALAGTRQQSRLIAIMNDFDRTLELVQTSEEAAGATAAQHLEYMKGMDGAMAQLKTSWQQFITTLTDSELIIGTIRTLSGAISGVAGALDRMGFSGQTAMAVILGGAAALKIYTLAAKRKEKQEQKGIISTILSTYAQRRNNDEIKEGRIASLLYAVGEKIKAVALIKSTITTFMATLATKGLKAAVDELWKSITLGLSEAVKWIIVGLTALIALLIGAKQHGEGASGFFASFFEAIKSIVGAVVSIVKVLFNLLKNILLVVLWPFITGVKVLMKLVTWIFDFLSMGFQIISNAIEAVVLWVKNLWKEIKKALGPIGKFFDTIVGGFKSFVKGIDNAIKGLKNWVNAWKRDLDDAKKSYEDLNKEIQKTVQENQAEAYNLGQKNKKIDELSKKYEELNNKEIKTDEDIEALEELRESIKELDETFITASGEVDVMRMLEVSEENKEKIRENLYNNALEVLRLARRDIEKFLKDEENIKVLGSLIGFDIREDTELSKMQEKALSLSTQGFVEKYQNELSSKKKGVREAALEDIERDTRHFLTEVEKLETQFEIQDELNNKDSTTNKLNAYKKALQNLDEEGRKSLARLLPEMDFAFRELQSYLQNDDFKEMMFELGFDGATFDTLSEALKNEGKDIGQFLNEVAKRQAELTGQGVESSLAFTQALSEQASHFEKVENRVALYGIAARKGTREIAGEFDNLNSKLKRVGETQDKFLKGDMTHTELLEFLEDYGDLLDEEGIENFMLGKAGFGASLREQLKEKEDEYRKHIRTLEAELKKATPERRKELELEIAKHKVLIQYSDELSKLTKRQYELNVAQEQYNRLKNAGIEDEKLFLDLLEAQILLGEEKVREAQQTILDRNEELQKIYGENYKDYFKVINGVFVWNYDLLKKHEKTANQNLREAYQEALDTISNQFESVKKTVLEHEKALADKKRKIYEDYFAALDKLEEKRERKQTREQLVKQLQRLEGATDEMSRKRAKDLRKELNELDKESAKKSQEESRKAFLEGINQALIDLEDKYNEVFKNLIKSGERSGEAFIKALKEAGLPWDVDFSNSPSGGGGGDGGPKFFTQLSYSKGGLVDYTGLANVHGSRSEPEAFLNVEQTKLFAQLRDNLVSSGSTNNVINIQNITIQTNELNNQQDFARAGDALAEAFGKAISARGISVNTKR